MLWRYLWETAKLLSLLAATSPLICCAGFTLALVLPPHQRDVPLGVQLTFVLALMLLIVWIIRAVVRQLDAWDARLLPPVSMLHQGIAAELNKLNWFRSSDAAHPASAWLKWSVTGKVVAIEGDRTWRRDLDCAARRADPSNDVK